LVLRGERGGGGPPASFFPAILELPAWHRVRKNNIEGYRGAENSQRNRGKPIFLCSSGFCLFLCTPRFSWLG
jgi:hypothetical protein